MFMQGNTLPTHKSSARVGAPLAIAQQFGSPKARPKVVQVYNPRIGWSALAKRVLLTEDLMTQLRTSGATMVDARWRSRRHRVALVDESVPAQ